MNTIEVRILYSLFVVQIHIAKVIFILHTAVLTSNPHVLSPLKPASFARLVV